MLEIWLPLKKGVIFFETSSKRSQYGYCKKTKYTQVETYANIFVDLLGGGHWSKVAALIHGLVASSSDIPDLSLIPREKRAPPTSLLTPVDLETLSVPSFIVA